MICIWSATCPYSNIYKISTIVKCIALLWAGFAKLSFSEVSQAWSDEEKKPTKPLIKKITLIKYEWKVRPRSNKTDLMSQYLCEYGSCLSTIQSASVNEKIWQLKALVVPWIPKACQNPISCSVRQRSVKPSLSPSNSKSKLGYFLHITLELLLLSSVCNNIKNPFHTTGLHQIPGLVNLLQFILHQSQIHQLL